jgi:F-type H+-transporting ATPase subunit b
MVMRWFVLTGLVTFCVSWAGLVSFAQDAEEHDHAAPAGDAAHLEEGAEHPDEADHPDEDHAEHQPIYDGDHDGKDEDYNQPPLKELTAFRFLFALGLFVAFVFVMRKIAWVPLIAAFDAREARVNEAHAFAANARTEIQALIQQHEDRIAETRDEVKNIVAAARQDAERAKSEIIAQADAEARELQERSIAEIHAAREEVLGQLSGQVDEYTDLAVGQIVGRASRN